MADSWLDVSRKSTEGNATFAESTAFNRTSGSSCQAELFLISVLAGGYRVHFVEISLKALLRSNHEKNVSSEQKAIFARAITRQCKKENPRRRAREFRESFVYCLEQTVMICCWMLGVSLPLDILGGSNVCELAAETNANTTQVKPNTKQSAFGLKLGSWPIM